MYYLIYKIKSKQIQEKFRYKENAKKKKKEIEKLGYEVELI